MALQVRQLNCPNCGAPLNIQSPGAKQVVCPNCGSQIDLTRPPFSAIGNVGRRPEPIGVPFQLGMQGTVGSETYAVIGRIRYRDSGETYAAVPGYDDDDEDDGADLWDEWLLLSAQGAYRWFSDSEDVGLVVWYPFTPTIPVDPRNIRRGGTIDVGSGPSRVRSRGSAVIEYLEGEMTWSARVGDSMNYAEAVDRAGTLISVEWTENEVEFFSGQRLDRNATAQAFGVQPSETMLAGAGAGGGGAGRFARRGCGGTFFILLVVLVIACILIALITPGVSSGSSGGIRTGSSGRSFGGGSSGGSSGGGGGK